MRACPLALIVVAVAATACGTSDPHPADKAAARLVAAAPTLLLTREIPGSPPRGAILAIDVLTNAEREITLDDDVPTAAIAADWSPDARLIAVTRSLGTREGDRFQYEASDVWIAGADGRGSRRLTHGEDGYGPIWTPDATAIAFTHLTIASRETPEGPPTSTAAIWLVPLSGDNAVRLTRPPTGSVDLAGSFSPDGRTLAFTRCDTARPYDPGPSPIPCAVWLARTGAGEHRLAIRARDPDWAPDGTTVIYAGDRDQNGEMSTGSDESAYALDLYRIRADGTASTNITNTPKLSESEPSISPGGAFLAYTQRGAYDYDRRVAIANVDATCPRQIKPDRPSDTSGWYSAPEWRPGRSDAERALPCEDIDQQ